MSCRQLMLFFIVKQRQVSSLPRVVTCGSLQIGIELGSFDATVRYTLPLMSHTLIFSSRHVISIIVLPLTITYSTSHNNKQLSIILSCLLLWEMLYVIVGDAVCYGGKCYMLLWEVLYAIEGGRVI